VELTPTAIHLQGFDDQVFVVEHLDDVDQGVDALSSICLVP
jgi:hypothetical protein